VPKRLEESLIARRRKKNLGSISKKREKKRKTAQISSKEMKKRKKCAQNPLAASWEQKKKKRHSAPYSRGGRNRGTPRTSVEVGEGEGKKENFFQKKKKRHPDPPAEEHEVNFTCPEKLGRKEWSLCRRRGKRRGGELDF